MIQCFFVRKQLYAYSERSLAEKRFRHIARHLEYCVACRKRADELKDILQAARHLPAPEPSSLFWQGFKTDLDRALNERIASDVRERPLSRQAGMRVSLRPAFSYLAITLFMLSAGVYAFTYYRKAVAETQLVNEAVVLDEVSDMAGLSDRNDELLDEFILLNELSRLPAKHS